MSKVLSIIPAKNEAETVEAVVRGARLHCAVLVVDDHSTDATAAIAKSAGAEVTQPAASTGYGAAILQGLTQGLQSGYERFVTLDADAVHDPRDLPAMLRAHVDAAAELTLGDRFAADRIADVPSAKRWANHLATAVLNKALNLGLRDVLCGFRVLERTLARQLVAEHPVAGFGLALQILQLAVRFGSPIGTCPVRAHYPGTELHATGQQEMLDALGWLSSKLPGGSALKSEVDRLKTAIQRMQPVTTNAGGVRLCLHPIGKSYIVQRHPDSLLPATFGDFFDLDML